MNQSRLTNLCFIRVRETSLMNYAFLQILDFFRDWHNASVDDITSDAVKWLVELQNFITSIPVQDGPVAAAHVVLLPQGW